MRSKLGQLLDMDIGNFYLVGVTNERQRPTNYKTTNEIRRRVSVWEPSQEVEHRLPLSKTSAYRPKVDGNLLYSLSTPESITTSGRS